MKHDTTMEEIKSDLETLQTQINEKDYSAFTVSFPIIHNKILLLLKVINAELALAQSTCDERTAFWKKWSDNRTK